ncbi:hypothetical protein BC567DRAFT_221484 [Phyllosticta citribraziliensis]
MCRQGTSAVTASQWPLQERQQRCRNTAPPSLTPSSCTGLQPTTSLLIHDDHDISQRSRIHLCIMERKRPIVHEQSTKD